MKTDWKEFAKNFGKFIITEGGVVEVVFLIDHTNNTWLKESPDGKTFVYVGECNFVGYVTATLPMWERSIWLYNEMCNKSVESLMDVKIHLIKEPLDEDNMISLGQVSIPIRSPFTKQTFCNGIRIIVPIHSAIQGIIECLLERNFVITSNRANDPSLIKPLQKAWQETLDRLSQ